MNLVKTDARRPFESFGNDFWLGMENRLESVLFTFSTRNDYSFRLSEFKGTPLRRIRVHVWIYAFLLRLRQAKWSNKMHLPHYPNA